MLAIGLFSEARLAGRTGPWIWAAHLARACLQIQHSTIFTLIRNALCTDRASCTAKGRFAVVTSECFWIEHGSVLARIFRDSGILATRAKIWVRTLTGTGDAVHLTAIEAVGLSQLAVTAGGTSVWKRT
jgi:hypothetical protein